MSELMRAMGAEGLFWKAWNYITEDMDADEYEDFKAEFGSRLMADDEIESFKKFLKVKGGEG